jgi:hypothetical protein
MNKLILAALLVACASGVARARITPEEARGSKSDLVHRVMILDGSPVHNVGELLLHTGNFATFGSMPGSGMEFADAPSAEWPAGSGTEYLYLGGLWVGAIQGGVPCVSSGGFEFELRPSQSPTDIVYRSAAGATGGNRLPAAGADDDGDGAIDEEWLDGWDNDGDALVDEDFAAISDQMFSCLYTDQEPSAIQTYPNHNPLHIAVWQRSYQWANDDFDDFVAIEYTIRNIGIEPIEEIYLGIWMDCDVGSRTTPNYWEDDATAYRRIPVRCTPDGPVTMDYAYMYDADGDGGSAPGYFGVLLLGHTTDPEGDVAPSRVVVSSFASINAARTFEEGGPPTNDFERYTLLASQVIRRDASVPQDYRILLSFGPFFELLPDSSLDLQIALVATPRGDFTNVAQAALAYKGIWHNADGDPTTGIAGRETKVVGPATVAVDTCRPDGKTPIHLSPGEELWINNDCPFEQLYKTLCGYSDADSAVFQTGVGGAEMHIPWVLPDEYVPVSIAWFDAHIESRSVELAWNVVADEAVEGFRIYRRGGGSTGFNPAEFAPIHQGLVPTESRSFVDSGVAPGGEYDYLLVALHAGGSETRSRVVTVTVPAAVLELSSVHPNPFNPSTSIRFVVPEDGTSVSLAVYDTQGKLVRHLVRERSYHAGAHWTSWDGTNELGERVASGVYYIVLSDRSRMVSRKAVVLK